MGACSSSDVLFWFAILAPVIVAEVFRSPMIDYRIVVLGAVAPLAEALLGRPNLLHTLLGAVGMLTIVMVATQGKRLLRRKLLGLPIGLMLHLVLDFTWAEQELLWWPGFGTDFPNHQVPAFDRPLGIGLTLEVVALVVGVWAARRYELTRAENRRRLFASGQLSREVLQ